MAEIKYLKCDLCDKVNAIKFWFRGDSFIDGAGSRDWDNYDIDLCVDHTKKLVGELVSLLSFEQQVKLVESINSRKKYN